MKNKMTRYGLPENEIHRESISDRIGVAVSPQRSFVKMMSRCDTDYNEVIYVMEAIQQQEEREVDMVFSQIRQHLGRIEIITARFGNSANIPCSTILGVELCG